MAASASNSVQGRLLSEHVFPAQADECNYFLAKSRCIIDMGSSFLVVPEGSELEPYQRRVFRLEVVGKRETLQFADDSCLSEEDCCGILQSILDELPHCDIVGTNFPYFARQELLAGQYKNRPCVAFYGDDGAPPLFVGVFLGTPKDKYQDSKFVIVLKSPGEILPEGTGDAVVDCSKIASFPEVYNLPDDEYKHEQLTWKPYRINKEKPLTFSNQLRPTNPGALRQVIVDKLLDLLRTNPHLDYVDLTIQCDIGTFVEGRKLDDDGEWCNFRKIYEGPPGYSPLPSQQSLVAPELEQPATPKQPPTTPRAITP